MVCSYDVAKKPRVMVIDIEDVDAQHARSRLRWLSIVRDFNDDFVTSF